MLGPVRDLGRLDGPLLVFGGPYGNLPAARAVRAEAGRRGLGSGQVICTGDLAAYCAEPAQTLGLVRDWDVAVVMGNCEESLGWGAADCGCGFEEGTACAASAERWYTYSAACLGARDRAWMRGLPRALRFELGGRSFLVVHGGVERINRFIFPSTPAQEKQAEQAPVGTQLVIGGHSGIPFGERTAAGVWLNTGVIGMPANDGTPDGWYMMLEPMGDGVCVRWHRLGYDARAASRAVLEAGLDPGYADALLTGIWPSQEVLPEAERARMGKPIDLPDMLV